MLKLPEHTDSKTERFEALSKLIKLNLKRPIDNAIVGVEVGVRQGITTRYLLEHHKNLILHLVDSYLPYKDIHETLNEDIQNDIKQNAIKYLKGFENRIIWHYKTSTEAAKVFPDYIFDFVFIDANHTTEEVYNDCAAWFSKIRPGGFLCGHDYCHPPVSQGVHRFRPHDVYKVPCEGDIWVIEV